MKNDYPKLRAYLRSMSPVEQERFATKCGTSLNYLRKAMSKGSKMDAHLVEQIVRESRHMVPPEELRPDVKWDTFADAFVVGLISNPKAVKRRIAEAAAPS